MIRTGSIDVTFTCPYCEYRGTHMARDIRGELTVVRCIDCKQPFVVEVTCAVTHKVRPLADIDKNKVLDDLVAPKGPKLPTAKDVKPRVRRQHGTRY